MDYEVCYYPYTSNDELGFTGRGKLVITPEEIRVTGRPRRDAMRKRLNTVGLLILASIALLLIWIQPLKALLGNGSYWTLLGGMIIAVIVIVVIDSSIKRTRVIPHDRLQRIAHQGDTLTIAVTDEQGDARYFVVQTDDRSQSRLSDLANALTAHQPGEWKIRFGYDISADISPLRGKGKLSLGEHAAEFTGLRRLRSDDYRFYLWMFIGMVGFDKLINAILALLPHSASVQALTVTIAYLVLIGTFFLVVCRWRCVFNLAYARIRDMRTLGRNIVITFADATVAPCAFIFQPADPAQTASLVEALREKTAKGE